MVDIEKFHLFARMTSGLFKTAINNFLSWKESELSIERAVYDRKKLAQRLFRLFPSSC